MPPRPYLVRLCTVLLCLPFWLASAHAQPSRTPRQVIDMLGVEIRQILENAKSTRTPEDAERAAAEQISALVRSTPGHLSLTEADKRGRTPLMLAAGHSYALVVQALLDDPSVKLTVDVADADGETAWMVANFVPAMTLPACQPGNLTVERYTLMQPYLRRMSHLVKTKAAAVTATIAALEAAGAQRRPDEGKRAWLARCPNAAPDLRKALAEGDVMPTLVNTAVVRQAEYVKATREGPKRVTLRPPKDMRFVRAAERQHAVRLIPQLQVDHPQCGRMPKPELDHDALSWYGKILFRAVASTRAGVVEVADIDVLAVDGGDATEAADFFGHLVLRTLARYHCEGDFVFEQEFQFFIN